MNLASGHPYDNLTPDVTLAAVESVGFITDGRILALNSYENRVYQVGVEEGPPVVAKFYRPGRWTREAIVEEHGFAWQCTEADVPVVPPLRRAGETLFKHAGFQFAVYERHGGHWPEFNRREEREWMGRFMGRLHMVGKREEFVHRPVLGVEQMGEGAAAYLLKGRWIPEHLRAAYAAVTEDLVDRVYEWTERAGELNLLRLHGDCHPGNVLWTDEGPHFVDLDDCMMGPAVQDLWMLLSGTRSEMAQQLSDMLTGYAQFAQFDRRELMLIESLRSLRMINYSAWLARRWEDPAFPRAFPWFAEPRYWEGHILSLKEQLAAVAEGPLVLA
jgi:Ser/Thr protein kinase RdoA (MazF antagonist)